MKLKLNDTRYIVLFETLVVFFSESLFLLVAIMMMKSTLAAMKIVKLPFEA